MGCCLELLFMAGMHMRRRRPAIASVARLRPSKSGFRLTERWTHLDVCCPCTSSMPYIALCSNAGVRLRHAAGGGASDWCCPSCCGPPLSDKCRTFPQTTMTTRSTPTLLLMVLAS